MKTTYWAGGYALGLILGLASLPGSKPQRAEPGPGQVETTVASEAHPPAEIQEKPDPTPQQYATLEEAMEAIRLALAEPSEELRKRALKRVAQAVKIALLPELQPKLERHSHRLVQNEMTEYTLRRWAKIELKSAMAYVQSRPSGWRRQKSLQIVASEWVKTDEESALAWVRKQPPSENAFQLLRTMLAALAEKSPDKALQIASADASQKRELLQAVLAIWAEKKPGGRRRRTGRAAR